MVKIVLGKSPRTLFPELSDELSDDEKVSAEAYLMNLLTNCQIAEASAEKNPKKYNFFTSSESGDPPWVITAIANIPILSDTDEYGRGLFYAKPDLYVGAYSSGTEGTFRATTLPQAFMEVAMCISRLQKDASRNSIGADYVQWGLRQQGADYQWSAQVTIPILFDVLPDGGKVSKAVEWLEGSL